MPEKKTFRSTCHHCTKPFHIRCELQSPDAKGSAEVAVGCPYCGGNVIVPIPRVYQAPGERMVMNINSVPAPEE